MINATTSGARKGSSDWGGSLNHLQVRAGWINSTAVPAERLVVNTPFDAACPCIAPMN